MIKYIYILQYIVILKYSKTKTYHANKLSECTVTQTAGGDCVPDLVEVVETTTEEDDKTTDSEEEVLGRCYNGKVYQECATDCTATCDDPKPVCAKKMCVRKCACPPEKPIEHRGVCVEQSVCPKPGPAPGPDDGDDEEMPGKCYNGQVYKECGSACTSTCADPIPACEKTCVRKCECPPEMPLLHNNKCIKQESCPAKPGMCLFS